MSHIIDNRLLEPDGEMEIIEDFNRVLNLVDDASNLIVTLTYNETDEEWTADVEPSAIYAAYGKSQTIIIKIDDGETVTAANVLFADSEEDEIMAASQVGNAYVEVLYSDSAWSVTPSSILPAVESTDAGKVLTVDNQGKWAAANPPTELPSATSSDEGKVVMVDSNGNYVLGTVAGGGVSETAIPATVNTPTLGTPTATEVTE